MKKIIDFLPKKNSELDAFEYNFLVKISVIGPEMGFTLDDISSVQNAIIAHRESYQEWYKLKQDLAQSRANMKTNAEIAVAQIRKMAQLIKNDSLYTRGKGDALGIISSVVKENIADVKPVLRLAIEGGNIQIRFKKYGFSGVKIFSKRGLEKDFTLLGSFFNSPFTDLRANMENIQTEKREYYAYFFYRDNQVGQPSDICNINV